MNKEQQIEEMARDIYEQKSCDTSFEENCKILAYDLVTLGYQKIDKDSAVLSREEQERILTATEKRIKELKRQILQARKETAEKILNELLVGFRKNFYLKNMSMTEEEFGWVIDEIAREFDVEIKE